MQIDAQIWLLFVPVGLIALIRLLPAQRYLELFQRSAFDRVLFLGSMKEDPEFIKDAMEQRRFHSMLRVILLVGVLFLLLIPSLLLFHDLNVVYFVSCLLVVLFPFVAAYRGYSRWKQRKEPGSGGKPPRLIRLSIVYAVLSLIYSLLLFAALVLIFVVITVLLSLLFHVQDSRIPWTGLIISVACFDDILHQAAPRMVVWSDAMLRLLKRASERSAPQ